VRSSVFLLFALSCQAADIVYQKELPASLVALDPSGNVYVAGSSISKLDSTGNVLYSKQVSLPGDWYAIAADADGNLVIAGSTTSDAMPTTPGVLQPHRNAAGVCISGDKSQQHIPCADAFLAKLDSTGNLAWATYLGGSNHDYAYGVSVDSSGNIYVTGLTESSDFQTVSAFQGTMGGYADVFIAKISGDGTRLLYSSFAGGAGYDVGKSVAVDSAGNAYVVGVVQGTGLPAAPGGFGTDCPGFASCGFLVKVAPAGDRIVFAGYLGGAQSYSEATAVTIDSQGNVYLGGETNAADFPMKHTLFPNTGTSPYGDFIVKVSSDGARWLSSTLLPGGSFGIYNIAVDSSGAVYATGNTSSNTIPPAGPALQPCAQAGLTNYFLLKLSADASVATYFSYEETATRMALSSDGALYEAGGSLRKLASLDSPGGPFLSRLCVMNAASFVSHLEYGQPGISPGELVMLTGTGLGPAAGAAPSVAQGTLANSVAGVQVFFDGTPAPLVYVQDRQINAIAPYNLAGKAQTSIQVSYQDQTTQAVTIPVSPISAASFLDSTTQQPLLFNQDFSINSVVHPATRGSVVVLYTTGAGQTSPPSVDGQVWQAPGALQTPVTAQLQNINISPLKFNAPVVYAGPVPSVVSAVQQFNISIPPNLPPTFFTPVTNGNGFLSVTIGSQTVTVPIVVR
jgi:uncharacterized protein (TIGR03437 family)